MSERMKLGTGRREKGFSTMELMMVVAISIIITSIAVPLYVSTTQFLRLGGDLRAINGATAQAKLRAASYFTHARVYVDLTNNTYQLQVWNKTGAAQPPCPTCAFVSQNGGGGGGTGCWVADSDPTQTCVSYSGSAASGPGVMPLGTGDSYGFGSVSTGPTPGQSTISQAAACPQGGSNAPGGGGTVSSTACIEFNSRGIPVDSNGVPSATGAYYVTNGKAVDGVTVSATGSIQAWTLPHGQTNWKGL